MLHYLGIYLRDVFSPLNLFTYLTVRAGGAAITALLISLIIGPEVIRGLRALKVGQFIRRDHVADLHELHKKKEGTPTMGGALIIIATVSSLLLWGRFTNRLLLIAVLVFCGLGLVGFLDDYISLRRKHNKGLSARAKFAGQILIGLLLGTYLYLAPITEDGVRIDKEDVHDWSAVATVEYALTHGVSPVGADPSPGNGSLVAEEKNQLLGRLNELLLNQDLYAQYDWSGVALNEEGEALRARHAEGLSLRDQRRLNRILLETAFPTAMASVEGFTPDLHTKLEIPGLKSVFLPLGMAYILFVLLVIVGSSNAVNLTDGLDGLAIGASIISVMAYTAIAYVVSRSDWSRYLFLVYVPEASELFVFGAALLGAGLGFLWYNCHPAEVFMGDTGSLALGGALGTMAILTKQELLLILVGGLFVMEAGSVILQVASFKLRGKRIFRMSPLHHHFELLGWSETKVVIRFWIMAIVFALMSLSALKLR